MRRIQMQVRSELWRGFAAAHSQRMKERLAQRVTNVACAPRTRQQAPHAAGPLTGPRLWPIANASQRRLRRGERSAACGGSGLRRNIAGGHAVAPLALGARKSRKSRTNHRRGPHVDKSASRSAMPHRVHGRRPISWRAATPRFNAASETIKSKRQRNFAERIMVP